MNQEIPKEESLIEYPCQFTIKVMGAAIPEFRATVNEIAKRHDPQFNESYTKERYSKGNKYLSMSLSIYAISRDQLDAIYQDLTSSELVSWVL